MPKNLQRLINVQKGHLYLVENLISICGKHDPLSDHLTHLVMK